jgi:hypothetical protein
MAFDCDLGRVAAWSNVSGRVCYEQLWMSTLPAIQEHDIILFEIASPRIEGRTGAERYNRMRWALYNIFTATEIFDHLNRLRDTPTFLVSPSDKWTRSYPERLRHEMAQTKATNHDLREAESMIFFYGKNPSLWVPLPHYMELIVDAPIADNRNATKTRLFSSKASSHQ